MTNLMDELLILVDENDREIGSMEKLPVHEKGLLHRAFSVFIFNRAGELLLQQRADGKYHSGGLWTNTCCSHPRMGESLPDAAHRRLGEEMGMQSELEHQFYFRYKHQFSNGLTEHELDHVFFGKSDETPKPDPTEVKAWKYIKVQDLEKELASNSEKYTEWLRICFPRVTEHLLIGPEDSK